MYKFDKVLLIVDMQNDFIDGVLANDKAKNIVDKIVNHVMSFDGDLILLTQDEHDNNYLQTREGKNLPVPHCITFSDGWKINKKIYDACFNRAEINDVELRTISKSNFSAGAKLYSAISFAGEQPREIEVCGTCTDICVISNALRLLELFPCSKIIVYADLCAGTTEDRHKAALDVMRSCQINVIE